MLQMRGESVAVVATPQIKVVWRPVTATKTMIFSHNGKCKEMARLSHWCVLKMNHFL